MRFNVILVCLVLAISGCLNKTESQRIEVLIPKDSISELQKETLADTSFVSMNKYSQDFFYDMRYAGEDNFLKRSVYSCHDCMIRKEVADALI